MDITTDKNIHTTIDADGILLACIDMPGRSMNVFSLTMIDSLEHLLDYVDATADVRGVVLTSGKSAFLVGADLDMIREFTELARNGTYEALHALCGRLGRLFRRLECSSKPYIVAINGLALGGGLELALACHERVVVNDDKAVQLGLPEIKLGLLPGGGGTQRLPRLIDTGVALQMLLTGATVTASRAVELGLVNEAVPKDDLVAMAKSRARKLSSPCALWDKSDYRFEGRIHPKTNSTVGAKSIDINAVDGADKIAQFVGVDDQQRARYPAYDAIIKCVVGGAILPMTKACHWEMDVFVELIRNPVAGNMVRTLFLNRQRANKEGQHPSWQLHFFPALSQVQAAVRQAGLSEDAAVLAVALATANVWLQGHSYVDVDLIDVAVVSGGFHPAYTGGSFTYLRQTGSAQLRTAATLAAKQSGAAELFVVPEDIDRLIHVLTAKVNE